MSIGQIPSSKQMQQQLEIASSSLLPSAASTTAKEATKKSFDLFARIPTPLQGSVTRFGDWAASPIASESKTGLYNNITNAASHVFRSIAHHAENFAKNNSQIRQLELFQTGTTQIPHGLHVDASQAKGVISKLPVPQSAKDFLAKWGVKIADHIAPAARKTSDFIKHDMLQVAKGSVKTPGGIPFNKGSVAFAALFEAPDVIEAFKEGRGLQQSVQSSVKVGAGTLGAVAATAGAALLLGTNPVGWTALAIAGIGSAVGYMAGGKLTGFLGKNKKGLFEKEPKPEAAIAQKQVPAQFGSMTLPKGTVNPTALDPNMVVPFNFNNPLAGLPPLVS